MLSREPMKILDGTVVRTPHVGVDAISRTSVRPSMVSDHAGVAIKRDDLPPVEVVQILHLRAQGVDAGIDLCHRAAVIVVVARYKKDGLGHARHGDGAKVTGETACSRDVTGDGNAVRSGFCDAMEQAVGLLGFRLV